MGDLRLRTDEELDRRANDLSDAVDVIERVGVDYWLASGALLGAVREQDFIRWDWDVEIDVSTVQAGPLVPLLSRGFRRAGFRVGRTPKPGRFNLSIRRGGDRIGLWGFERKGDVWVKTSTSGFVVPDRFWGDETIELRGRIYRCHSDPEGYCAWTYGDDWRTPKRSADHDVYLTDRFRGKAA